MKTFGNIMKVLAVLATIAGAIYVAATYGDKIVAWAKKLMNRMKSCSCCCAEEFIVPADEIPTQEEPAQAEENDFEA